MKLLKSSCAPLLYLLCLLTAEAAFAALTAAEFDKCPISATGYCESLAKTCDNLSNEGFPPPAILLNCVEKSGNSARCRKQRDRMSCFASHASIGSVFEKSLEKFYDFKNRVSEFQTPEYFTEVFANNAFSFPCLGQTMRVLLI